MFRVTRAMRHHETWAEADLEDRLCRCLDVAARAVDSLGQPAGSRGEEDRPEDRLAPEKIVTETALLLLAAYVASGGADCVAARGGIRRRVHQLAEKLSPIARSERVMLALCLQPALALDFAAAHIYLTRIGYPDLRFDRILHQALWDPTRPTHQRPPHRRLEQEWLLWMGSVPAHRNGRQQALRHTPLACPMDLLNGSREDVNAFAFSLLYARDLDCMPLPLPRTRDEVLGEAEAALARCLDDEDYDLAGKVLLAWPYTGSNATAAQPGNHIWSPAATFGLEVLTRVEDRAGFLPSPATRVEKLRNLWGEERQKYLLASAYPTVYVMGFLCAAALCPGKLPPARVPEQSAIAGSAKRMLAHLEPEVQLTHWHEQFRLLDLGQQDTLAGLVFRIAMRRKIKARDYSGLAELLGEADDLGLTDCPMASQAASLLLRLHELNYAAPARHLRRRGSPAA